MTWKDTAIVLTKHLKCSPVFIIRVFLMRHFGKNGIFFHSKEHSATNDEHMLRV